MNRPPAIGIDLGTTDSCVAVFRNGTVEVINNDRDNSTTPSYVAFTNNGRLIGESAKNQVATNPNNTIFAFKRLVGSRYGDSILKAYLKHWPFEIVNHNDTPKIIVSYKGQPKFLSLEELSAMVLGKMKETAETYLGTQVQDAVITVPSSFNNAQRQATKNAAIIAGLNPIRIINEPTAAAVAFGYHRREKGERMVLIFDLGGGTCNVSILSIDDKIFEVKATAGDNTLGGEDFDERLMEHFIKQFREKHKKDITSSKRALNRLRVQCEKVKRVLSSITQTVVEIDSLFDGIDFYTTISRKEFEKINDDLFKNAMKPVENALRDAKLEVSDIDEVILVGGSTRIPRIQKMLQDFFRDKELNRSMNMVEAVAHGAAIQAAILNGDKSTGLQDALLLDVVPWSLGIETAGGIMTSVIRRNSNIPVIGIYTHTVSSKGGFVEIKIYEGERALVKDNHLLGKFGLNLPATNQSEVNIDVTFDVDANSILKVTAVEMNSMKKCRITVSDYNQLNEAEIRHMIDSARRYQEDDEKQKEVFAARNDLESRCYSLKDKSSPYVSLKCDEILAWLETVGQEADKEEIKQKRSELENAIANPNQKLEVTEASSNILSSAEETLNKLKCNICGKYLSYFPIYINSDKGSVCGRCPDTVLNDNPIRNTSYESVAELLKFPCIYHVDGCLRNLYPIEVPNHEKSCPFRLTSCVLCTWEGAINNLLKHFETEHPTSIRRNPEFEIDFTHTYEILELLVYKDEIFSFKRKYLQSKKILECSLFCYKIADSKYNYQISLYDASDESLSVKYPPTSTDSFHEGNVTEIMKNQIKKDLHDPTAILGIVQILELEELQPPNEQTRRRTNPEVNYDLLSELECPVCFNYIVPPIYQCITGHSICEECKEHISECPICKKNIQSTHNITLEKVARLLIYPCKFVEYGCDYASKPSDIKQHQKYCVHGPYPCPFQDYNGCDEKVSIKNMLVHAINIHRDHFLGTNTIEVPVSGRYYNSEDYACYMIKFRGALFKLQYLYKMSVFYWAVQLFGLPEEAKKYQFEIDICDNSGNKRRMFLRSCCAPLAKKESSFDAVDKYVFIKVDQISSFITDVFTYKIHVII